MPTTLIDRLAFVRANTAPAPVPLVPEISLYQASDVTPLWHATALEIEGWDPAPFWAFPWAGGQALARHLLDAPDLVRGLRAFDFATGSGLVALAATRAGASSVTACDLDPFCEAAIAANSELNGAVLELRSDDAIGDALDGFDVVLAGDVFYERALAERSLPWFRALARRGALVLVGDPGRLYSPAAGLDELASYDVPTAMSIEGAPMRRTSVFRVLPA